MKGSLLASFLLFSTLSAQIVPYQLSRKIESALLLDEKELFLRMSEEALSSYPEDSSAHILRIRALGEAGEEMQMMEAYEQFQARFGEEAIQSDLLEMMAFSILKKGKLSSNLEVRRIALIALALTQDIEGVVAVREALLGSNMLIRALGVELAAMYGDQSLREVIIRLFREERSREVRPRLYRAIATLKVNLMKELVDKATRETISSQERGEILKAMVAIADKVEGKELERFATSSSSLVRALVAKEIAKQELRGEVPLLIDLAYDSNVDVKRAALEAMAVLRVGEVAAIKPLAFDTNPDIGIPATHLLLLLDEKEGTAACHYWLNSSKIEVQRHLSAVLSKAGRRALPIVSEWIKSASDPFVKVHLGIALLKERVDCVNAASLVYDFLNLEKEPLMWSGESFSEIKKSTLTSHPLIANIREAKDQALRLELLNLLAIVNYPKAKEAIYHFLNEKKTEAMSIAAEILINEGDQEIIDILKGFLKNEDKKIRLETALLLTAIHEEEAEVVLKELYPKAPVQDKIAILEALGRSEDRALISFFVQEFKNPSQTIRLAAASMLVHTLRS